MTDTTTSAVLSDLPCLSCRAKAQTIDFVLPIGKAKKRLTLCAICLVGIVDQALSTHYVSSLTMGLLARAIGGSATEKKRRYRARKRARLTT